MRRLGDPTDQRADPAPTSAAADSWDEEVTRLYDPSTVHAAPVLLARPKPRLPVGVPVTQAPLRVAAAPSPAPAAAPRRSVPPPVPTHALTPRRVPAEPLDGRPEARLDAVAAAPAPVEPAPVEPAPVEPAPVEPATILPAPLPPAPATGVASPSSPAPSPSYLPLALPAPTRRPRVAGLSVLVALGVGIVAGGALFWGLQQVTPRRVDHAPRVDASSLAHASDATPAVAAVPAAPAEADMEFAHAEVDALAHEGASPASGVSASPAAPPPTSAPEEQRSGRVDPVATVPAPSRVSRARSAVASLGTGAPGSSAEATARDQAPPPAEAAAAPTATAPAAVPTMPELPAELEPLEAPAPSPQSGAGSTAPSPASASTTGATTGTLNLSSDPPGVVYIDGELRGYTPLTGIRMTPGRHRVLLVNPERPIRRTLFIDIEPGQSVSRSANLHHD